MRAADADDFEIDENGVLTAYKGSATDVVIPEGVTDIGERAFASSTVEHVTIPAAVRSIGNEAFIYSSLTKVTFQDDEAHPSQLTSIGERTFANTSLEAIELPRSVVTIGAEVFDYDSALTSIKLGPNVAADATGLGVRRDYRADRRRGRPREPELREHRRGLVLQGPLAPDPLPGGQEHRRLVHGAGRGHEHRTQGLPEGGHHHRGAARQSCARSGTRRSASPRSPR